MNKHLYSWLLLIIISEVVSTVKWIKCCRENNLISTHKRKISLKILRFSLTNLQFSWILHWRAHQVCKKALHILPTRRNVTLTFYWGSENQEKNGPRVAWGCWFAQRSNFGRTGALKVTSAAITEWKRSTFIYFAAPEDFCLWAHLSNLGAAADSDAVCICSLWTKRVKV